jgi:hypothetical protein
MRVLVCGGRNFRDRHWLNATLSAIHAKTPITKVIQGGAGGADALAKEWARRSGVHCHQEDARWTDLETPPVLIRYRRDGTAYNALAGPNRNAKMLKEQTPELVVAFPGGSGTADMMSQARAAGIEVREVIP